MRSVTFMGILLANAQRLTLFYGHKTFIVPRSFAKANPERIKMLVSPCQS